MALKISNTIRKQVLAGNSSDVRNLLLTQQQISLIDHIRKAGNVSASEIAIYKKVSIQNASSKLNKLYLKGYLTRTMLSAESGGIEYIYKITKGL